MGEEAAIDEALARDPADVRALVAKADLLAGTGNDRLAADFYRAALRAAAVAPAEGLAAHVQRAQAGIARVSGSFETHLEQGLAARGFPVAARPPRFQESIDILTGRRRVELQLQRPGGYLFPGLPQRRYYERSEFGWAAGIEALAPVMRDELDRLRSAGPDAFTPYMVADPDRPRHDFHGMVDNPDWSTLYLWENGGPVEAHAAACPRTFEAVMQLDLPHITRRAPSVLFSRLSPGARIPPHTGVLNTRLICHLPLVVPPGCGFRVGGETREWRVGELIVFDDTVEHEAWNDGTSERIVLIFDVWRPELDPRERDAVTALFEVVDSYGS